MICYLDLDGVLVDFTAGALAVHGKHLEPADIRWDFNEQLDLTPDQFWRPLDAAFWAGLGWTHEGRDLLAEIERLFGERVVILTSPCKTAGAVEGKVEWIRKHLPAYYRRFLIGAPKHLVAGPDKILVDDHNGNVRKFVSHGGRAVLVPRPWNALRVATTGGRFNVQEVVREIEELAGEKP